MREIEIRLIIIGLSSLMTTLAIAYLMEGHNAMLASAVVLAVFLLWAVALKAEA